MSTFKARPDAVFVLESAAWPAFLIDAGGTIRRANQSAIGLFGPMLEGDSTSLSALWAEESETAEQFLARWERAATAVVGVSEIGATFQPSICKVGVLLSAAGSCAVRVVDSPGFSSIQLSDQSTGATKPPDAVRTAARS